MKKSLLLFLLCLPVFARGQTLTGTITASQCVSVNVLGSGTVGINVSGGSWTGTIQPKILADTDGNATASNAQVTPYSSSTAQATITANGDYSASVVGATWFQLCGNTVTNTATVKLTPVRLAANRNAGTGNGTVTGSSFTAGLPVHGNGGTGIAVSAASFDVTAFAGADPCVASRTTFTSAANGQVVDMRGFSTTASLASYGATTWPDIKCSIDPIPTTAAGSLLLPPGILHMQVAFANTIRVDVTGMGWDTNVSNAGGGNGTGIGATVIAGCKSTDSACGGVNFPAAPGGPIVCWGAQGKSGGCDRGGDNPIFDSPIRRLTVDCNAILGAIGVQDMNAEEGSGLETVKIENCYNDGRGLSIAGGVVYNFASTVTFSGTTVTGSGFTSDLLFNQIQASTDVTCPGSTPCNYTVASINSAGTVLTLDTSYTGTACTSGGGCTLNNSNAAAQNGFFHNLYIVHRIALTATANGIAIAMNTGSGSNEGPKYIRNVTAVNSNATQVNDMIRLNGCCTNLEDIHEESFVDGVSFGKDNVANGFSLTNLWVGSVSAGSSSTVTISNSFSSANIGLYQLKTIAPNKPTNVLKDLIGGNTITTISESSMQMYVLGSSSAEIVTSSHTVPSKFFGLQSATTVTLNATSAAAGTGIGQVASNALSLNANGTEQARVTSTGIRIPTATGYGSASAIGSANDVALVRAGAAIYEISDGGNNANGFLKQLGAVRVTADQTINGSTSLTNITGLSWAIPSTAVLALHFECDILYNQATAAVADQFGVQGSATMSSGTAAMGQALTSATAFTAGNISFTSTAAQSIVTFTPSVITTVWNAHLAGTIVNPVSTANTVNIMAATSNTSDALVIKAGSGCHAWVTSN